MRHLALVALISMALAAPARAASEDDEDWNGSKESTKESTRESAKESTRDAGKSGKKASGKRAAAQTDEDADEPDAEPAPKPLKAAPAPAPAEGDSDEITPPISEVAPGSQRPPVFGTRSDWFISTYGYARFDAMEDTTQSFEDGIQPNLIARAGTYRGDHRRTIFTARDSRLGFFIGAPTYQGMKSSGVIELDFYGLVPTDARRHDSVVFGPLRIRMAFLKLETSIVDIIAGQYYDLFGWGSYFYPATVAYLGVPAQIYHRDPQLRIEKKVHLGQLEVMASVAAVRPGQRDAGVPDGQAGLKLAYGGWLGTVTPGFGRPTLSPLSIGVSGLYRRFEVPAFRAEPGSEAVRTFGWGAAGQLVLPIIPAKKIEDHGNSLTVTGEYSIGTGIADMYTFMDGGSRFPLLPNPNLAAPAIQYPSNVDPGLVTFDRNFELKSINWQALVVGAQYYLPIGNGRVWVSGIYSRTWSDNIKELTPPASWGGIFTKMEYFDGNLGVDITPAVALGLSFQSVRQTFADVSPDYPNFGQVAGTGPLSIQGTGGIPARARNDRAQLSMSLFF